MICPILRHSSSRKSESTSFTGYELKRVEKTKCHCTKGVGIYGSSLPVAVSKKTFAELLTKDALTCLGIYKSSSSVPSYGVHSTFTMRGLAVKYQHDFFGFTRPRLKSVRISLEDAINR